MAKRLLAALALLLAATAARAESWERLFPLTFGDLRAELNDAKSNGRKGLFVMYHFDECPYCRKMKAGVLARREVQDWYLREFGTIAIDTRGSQTITGFDGKQLPENEYARAVRVNRTPSFDFYGLDGKLLYRHAGAIYDVEEFLALGRFIAGGAYRSQSFRDYVTTQQKKER
jgi:thioredoxin-related protein